MNSSKPNDLSETYSSKYIYIIFAWHYISNLKQRISRNRGPVSLFQGGQHHVSYTMVNIKANIIMYYSKPKQQLAQEHDLALGLLQFDLYSKTAHCRETTA